VGASCKKPPHPQELSGKSGGLLESSAYSEIFHRTSFSFLSLYSDIAHFRALGPNSQRAVDFCSAAESLIKTFNLDEVYPVILKFTFHFPKLYILQNNKTASSERSSAADRSFEAVLYNFKGDFNPVTPRVQRPSHRSQPPPTPRPDWC